MLLLAHPAPDPETITGLEAGQEKEDPISLPTPCQVVLSQTPILHLSPDLALHQRRGIVLIGETEVRALLPAPPLGPLPLCPAPLPEGGGTLIPPLVLVL